MTDPNPPQSADAESAPDEPSYPLLAEPADGVPPVVTRRADLQRTIDALAAGHGPVAVDAERASGYRYSQRAYLVQLRRDGSGTHLIDPIAVPDLHGLNEAISGAEWILHAANQDLACLAEVGLVPTSLFDSELAGRLLGEERVALGTMVERHLGVHLEKGHSAADWSTRPLPHDWLVYAALDVELLVALRAELVVELERAGKLEWAYQEFEAVRTAAPPPPRAEPWRRTSGIHAIRNRRQLAAVRSLWTSRDQLAVERDVAPGRVLPDSAIVDAVRKSPADVDALLALAVFGGPRQRRHAARWFGALDEARRLPESELPTVTSQVTDPIPPPARWKERSPAAAARLAAVRDVVSAAGQEHRVLAQNLLPADIVRRIAWEPPQVVDESTVRAALGRLGARPWQIDLLGAPLSVALLVAPASADPPTNADADPDTDPDADSPSA